MFDHRDEKTESLLYGGIALGIVAGAAMATYLWKRRTSPVEGGSTSPLDRAEQLIESCESKLESIERAITEIKAAR
jgi:hypothetical protein